MLLIDIGQACTMIDYSRDGCHRFDISNSTDGAAVPKDPLLYSDAFFSL